MPIYDYIALSSSGEESKGLIEASSERAAAKALRHSELIPLQLSISAAKKKPFFKRQFSGLDRQLKIKELSLLTRQLVTLIEAGTPLEETLQACAEQSDKKHIKKIILGLCASITAGQSFSQALTLYPRSFNQLYQASVDAGEKSGHLDATLNRLAEYLDKRLELQQSITLALIYPLLLVVVSLLVVIALLTYVVPQVVQVFTDMQQTLPLLTRGLLAISAFLRDYAWHLIAAITASYLLIKRLLKEPKIQHISQVFLLSLPLIGHLIRGINSSRFAHTLSMLTSSGVPVVNAFQVAAKVMPNLLIRHAVLEAAERVREGSSIAQALKAAACFPPIMLHLISSGELSGKLEASLRIAAEQQDREMKMLVATALALFEPLMIVFMGVLVLLIVLAIMLPIFELNELVA